MDVFNTLMRILHIVFGSFWVGATVFNVLILEPRLRRLGPGHLNPVMGAIMPVVVPAMISSGLIVIFTGFVLTFTLWGTLADLFTTTAGLVLLVGTVTSIGSAVVGLSILTPSGIRITTISKNLAGREPNAGELTELKRLSRRMETFTRVNFLFLVIALVTMSIMRYV